jgi:hypothetical protein
VNKPEDLELRRVIADQPLWHNRRRKLSRDLDSVVVKLANSSSPIWVRTAGLPRCGADVSSQCR